MRALDNIGSISRTSLHQELTERLRNMIIEGVLPAGEKVPERELCERMGVSRTPMREALKVLAADGLLVLEPNRGARVRTITVEELGEVFPLMGAFESLAGELACENITETQMQVLRDAHAAMLRCFHERDKPNYFRHNQRIHELILEAAGNNTLIAMYGSLSGRVRQARYLANMSAERWQQAVDEHELILEALEQRDGRRLSGILKAHLENKLDAVRQWLEDQA